MKSPSETSRKERLAAALRENLKRRKQKERASAIGEGARIEARDMPGSQKSALKEE
jgi:hypothetical protein